MLRGSVSTAVAVILALSATAVHADVVKVGGTGAAQGVLQRLGEAFAAKHPEHSVEVVPGLGSGGGISAVAEGALHIAVSSRQLKANEKAQGIEERALFDTPFAFVSSHAKPQKLTSAEIVAIFDGALTKWPDGREIKPVLRPKSDSATPFLIANFEGMQGAIEKLRQRPDVPVAATDQDNIEAAQKIANSFAGATLVQFITEQPRVRLVALDGVEPSVEAMEKGNYRLKMRLFAVSQVKASAATQQFLAFLQSAEGEIIVRNSGGAKVIAKSAAAH